MPESPMKTAPLGPTVTPIGVLSRATVPKPSRNEDEAEPAIVDTLPIGETMRMRLEPESATKRFPFAAKERCAGEEKEAEVPVPSASVAPPLPAKVDTVPLGRMSLMRWLPVSLTYTFPLASTTTPLGEENEAVLPMPLEKGALQPVPARVVTAPRGEILRMRWLPVSATYTTPAESTVRPEGFRNLAALP